MSRKPNVHSFETYDIVYMEALKPITIYRASMSVDNREPLCMWITETQLPINSSP